MRWRGDKDISIHIDLIVGEFSLEASDALSESPYHFIFVIRIRIHWS